MKASKIKMKNGMSVVVALAAIAVAAGCGGAKAKERGPTVVPATLIQAAAATEETVVSSVDVTGTLAAWEEAMIALEADGRIIEVRADLGDRVRKGEVLARIAPENYQFRKEQAEAELSAASAEFERLESLGKNQIATQQQLDEGKRRLSMARASAELARKQYADTSLRAPFDGMIARRMINAGEFGRTGAPAFSVVRTDPLKLKMEVSERYISDVKVGGEVEAWSDALPGETLKGKVVRVGPAVSADNRSFPVEARFENAGDRLKPGSFARAKIASVNAHATVLVPETAVVTFAGTPRVFVVDGGKASERTIEVLGRNQGRVMVLKGLAKGETVAVSNVDALSDGAKVTVQ